MDLINNKTQSMKNFQQIRAIGNEISDGIMDSWNKRNTSFDIMSQNKVMPHLVMKEFMILKQMKYIRHIMDLMMNMMEKDIKPVTDDMYLQKTSGYIEK